MGIHFQGVTFFGACLTLDKDYDTQEFNDKNDDLEIIDLNTWNGPAYVVFVKETYHSVEENEDQVFHKIEHDKAEEYYWARAIEEAFPNQELDISWWFTSSLG